MAAICVAATEATLETLMATPLFLTSSASAAYMTMKGLRCVEPFQGHLPRQSTAAQLTKHELGFSAYLKP